MPGIPSNSSQYVGMSAFSQLLLSLPVRILLTLGPSYVSWLL